MHNINDLFNERDMIIESMSYFNPLILEENNVILTEGFVGGLVEKIQALWKMIKGWITKLIDFVSSKFKRKNNTSNNSNKVNNEIKEVINDINKQTEEIVNERNDIKQKIEKNVDETHKLVEKIQNDLDDDKAEELRKEIDYAKKNISAIRKEIKFLPNKIKEQQEKIDDFEERYNKSVNKIYEMPDLIDAKMAISMIIHDCTKAMQTNKPSEYFNNKKIKNYFLKSNNKIKIPANEFLDNEIYKSYLSDAGDEYVDQLKTYQQKLDSTYKELENIAQRISESDTQRSKELLNKASEINKLTQRVLKEAIVTLDKYVQEISKYFFKIDYYIFNNDVNLRNARLKLDSLRQDLIDFNKMMAENIQTVKSLESQLNELE